MSQENFALNRKILADNVQKLRLERKIRREELSLMLGFDNSYISKFERGKINITIDKLSLLADFFNLDVKDLFRK